MCCKSFQIHFDVPESGIGLIVCSLSLNHLAQFVDLLYTASCHVTFNLYFAAFRSSVRTQYTNSLSNFIHKWKY